MLRRPPGFKAFGLRTALTALIALPFASTPASAEFEAPTQRPDAPTDDTSLKLRFFFGHDSNVQYFNDFLFPTPISPSNAFAGTSVEFSKTFALSDVWDGGITLRGDLVYYANGAFGGPAFGSSNDFDRYSVEGTFFAGRDFTLGNGTPGRLNTSVSIRREDSRDISGVGATSYTLAGGATFDIKGPWMLGVDATASYGDFDVLFPGDPASDRDGMFYELKGSAQRPVNFGPLDSVALEFGLQMNDAEGRNWDFTGYKAGVMGHFRLAPQATATLGANYTDRDYDGNFVSAGFPPPGRRNQQVTSFDAQIVWQFWKNMAADLSVSRQLVRSNSFLFEGDRTIVTFGITAQLK